MNSESNDANDDNDSTTVITASVDAHLLARVDDTVVEFVRNKEQFKEKLSLSGYNGHLCRRVDHCCCCVLLLPSTCETKVITVKVSRNACLFETVCSRARDNFSPDL